MFLVANRRTKRMGGQTSEVHVVPDWYPSSSCHTSAAKFGSVSLARLVLASEKLQQSLAKSVRHGSWLQEESPGESSEKPQITVGFEFLSVLGKLRLISARILPMFR